MNSGETGMRQPLGPAPANSKAAAFGSPAKLSSLSGEEQPISPESVAKNAARVIEALVAEVSRPLGCEEAQGALR